MRNVILLMLFCGSANAGMYSCVDDSGKKVFRSDPCEKNEKQQPVVKKVEPSYYIVNSTGEKQGIDSFQAKQAPKSFAQPGAPKNLYGRAKAEADSSRDQSSEVRAGIMERFIRAYRAEHCGANAKVPQIDSAQQGLYERAKAEADSSRDQSSEVRAAIMNRFMRAYRAENCMPEEIVNTPAVNVPVYITAPPTIIYR